MIIAQNMNTEEGCYTLSGVFIWILIQEEKRDLETVEEQMLDVLIIVMAHLSLAHAHTYCIEI